MTQTILPPLPASDVEPDSEWMLDPDALPSPYAFDPVPRKRQRSNGLTPEKQRRFIAYLAGCGSVAMAARAIDASTHALYQLRKAPGADSFAAAWEAAVEAGARRVLDTLIDHAIHGTPERLLKDGEVILERRKYNTRAMMWVVQQRFPEQYGGNLNPSAANGSLPRNLQALKDKWRAEWEAELEALEAEMAEHEAAAVESLAEKLCRIRDIFRADCAGDPAKRAAYELLTGPCDWSNPHQSQRYGNLPDANVNRPDIQLTFASEQCRRELPWMDR